MKLKLKAVLNEIKSKSIIKLMFNKPKFWQIVTEVYVQIEYLKQHMVTEIVIIGIPDKFIGKNILIDTFKYVYICFIFLWTLIKTISSTNM